MIGAYTSAVYSLNTQFATNIAIDGMVKKKMNESKHNLLLKYTIYYGTIMEPDVKVSSGGESPFS